MTVSLSLPDRGPKTQMVANPRPWSTSTSGGWASILCVCTGARSDDATDSEEIKMPVSARPHKRHVPQRRVSSLDPFFIMDVPFPLSRTRIQTCSGRTALFLYLWHALVHWTVNGV